MKRTRKAINANRQSNVLLAYLKKPFVHDPRHGHSFCNTWKMTWCSLCSKLIWNGISKGLICLRCDYCVHVSCGSKKRDIAECVSFYHDEEYSKPCEEGVVESMAYRQYFLKYGPYVAGGAFAAIIAAPFGVVAGVGSSLGMGIGVATGKKALDKRREDKIDAWAERICQKFSLEHVDSMDDSPHQEEFVKSYNPKAPNTKELRAYIQWVLATSNKPISQINVELLMKFRERHQQRWQSADINSDLACQAMVHDTKTYIGHMLAVILYTYPNMHETQASSLACSVIVEDVIYKDIYTLVFGEFEKLFHDKDVAFDRKLEQLSDPQEYSDMAQFKSAIQCLKQACNVAHPPTTKLNMFSQSFVLVCKMLEETTSVAPNADDVLPVVCSLIIHSRPVAFQTNLAFITAMTSGGGHGMEGYTLTTYQAAAHIVDGMDITCQGHEYYDSDEFYDASDIEIVSVTEPVRYMSHRSCQIGLKQLCGDQSPFPHSIQDELKFIQQDQTLLGLERNP